MSPANPEAMSVSAQPLRRDGYGAGMRARTNETENETSLSQPIKPIANQAKAEVTEAAVTPKRSLNALVQGMNPARRPAQFPAPTVDTNRTGQLETQKSAAPMIESQNLATAFRPDLPVEQQPNLLKYISPALAKTESVAPPSYESKKAEYQPREALELITASQSFVGDPFEAPNCIQTMRIDTVTGTRTTTTMLPDNSSTRIECVRADKSSSVTVTENLRSASSIKARPLSVRELAADGTLTAETRYYYHNFNAPTTPTAKSVISGNEITEYRLDDAGNIVDKLVYPVDKTRTA